MLTTTVLCMKCFAITNYSVSKNNAEQFVLGKKSWKNNAGYLFFPFDQFSTETNVILAELILYKKQVNEWEIPRKERYVIQATKTYLNPLYTYTGDEIRLIGEEQFYQVDAKEEILCMDVTALVKGWISGKVNNRGCLIRYLEDGKLIGIMGMESQELAPFIRITYSKVGGKKPAYLEAAIDLPAKVEIVEKEEGT